MLFMRKWMKMWLTVVSALTIVFCLQPLTSQAANPTEAGLQADVTYRNYDITGDRKADRILIKTIRKSSYGGDYGTGINVLINGKSAYRFNKEIFYSVNVRIYTLKNGKPFLYLYCAGDNDDGPSMLLQYKSKKLKKVIDFQKMFSGYGNHPSGEVVSVSGNSIKARFHLMSYTLGASQYTYTYKYKGGTLKRSSDTGNVETMYTMSGQTKVMTAGKELKAYTSVKGKKKAFTVKKGEKVTVNKIYQGKYGVWIGVKYKGKSGYLKCDKKHPNPLTFSNAAYAG